MFPSSTFFHYPILLLLADGKVHTFKELREFEVAKLSITPEQAEEMTPGGEKTPPKSKLYIWTDRAITDLRSALYITHSENGYVITESGRAFLKKHKKGFVASDLKASEAYRKYKGLGEFKKKKGKKETSPQKPTVPEPETTAPIPEKPITVRLSDLAASANAILPDTLLEAVKQIKPKSFEVLIKKLLIAMGYGKTEDDVIVTQYVGDNGIDGYVRKDRLDIEKICAYQAKRYTNTNVSITEMNALGGSMINCGTNCGIFVTTTDFTASAKKYDPRGYTIIRIDGKTLVGYLIEYGIGVKTERIEVKTVDIDFLNSL